MSDALAADLGRLAGLAVADDIALRLADASACALGAEALSEDRDGTLSRVRRAKDAASGGGRSTIWWSGETAAAGTAAFRNAVAVRTLDYNDTYVSRAIVHPSDQLPALIALAEERQASWDRLFGAISISYESLCRMADSTSLRKNGFDGASLTPISTAAGAAWLLELDEQTAAQALKIAALDAGTLRVVRQGRLSDWKTIASPRGSIKGLFAASMAEAGCLAPDMAFDGTDGFNDRVGGISAIGTDDSPRLSRTILKAYPAQIFIQGVIQLATELRERIAGATGDIESIRVRTFRQAVDMVGGHGTTSGGTMKRETADHSAHFAIAAIFISGRLGHEDYEPLLADPVVDALMAKIAIVEDPDASKSFPDAFPFSIELSRSDGTTLVAEQQHPAPLTADGLAEKFNEIWPAGIPRDWRWKLDGEAPRFPVPA